MKQITLYPKTQRTGQDEYKWEITEKLDGSNIGFFKLNDELYVAQRNRVYKASDVKEFGTYPHLLNWLEDVALEDDLVEGAVIFGEWLGQGRLKYDMEDFKRFNMFAKARIDDEFNVTNMVYRHDLLHYAFIEQYIPDYLNLVPLVGITETKPDVKELDFVYDEYIKDVKRDVEGFVISDGNRVEKYLRNLGFGIGDYNPQGHKGGE